MSLQRPLLPTYKAERARIAEHNEFMRAAQSRYKTVLICPDCYLPPQSCAHLKRRIA